HRPPARMDFAMTTDLVRGRVLVFGGRDGVGATANMFGDTWEWDGTDWVLRAVTGPSPRISPACEYDFSRGRIVLVGGSASSWLNEGWEGDGCVGQQAATATALPAPTTPIMAHDVATSANLVVTVEGPQWLLRSGAPASAAVLGAGCGGPAGPPEHRSDMP